MENNQPRSRGVIPAPGTTAERQWPLRLVLLGATGSIGRQTLDVVRRHSDKVELVAIAAKTSIAELVGIAREFPTVKQIAVADETLSNDPVVEKVPSGCSIEFGRDAVDALALVDYADCVLNALVGFSGMRASFNALSCGHELALANKESLVVAGDIIMPLAKPGKLLPVDSEHSAIFQCFLGEDPWKARRIWLTASGGPFFGMSRRQLENVDARQALAHPNWSMGAKVTIDSSTLMNKGLEAIEAHHLFDAPMSMIKPIVQRQSAVHSMVEYSDGSVISHIGAADMRVPIQYALSYPHRWEQPCDALDFDTLGRIDFANPDIDTFGCLRLALEAGEKGGILPCVLNAADEVAVCAFLDGAISYLQIEEVVGRTISTFSAQKVESLDHLEVVDADSRRIAQEAVSFFRV